MTHPAIAALGRPLRLGVIGGGPGSFIGPVHRSAATLDGCFTIVAGAVTSDAANAATKGAAIGLDPARSYASVPDMLAAEAARDDGRGIEAVAIMTPNDRHRSDSSLAMRAGLHVICDKPLANTAEDARALARLAEESGVVFCVTYTYAGYPMVRQARAMVEADVLGELRMVHVDYLQGGMAAAVERGPLTAKLRWKLDRERSGPSLVLGDIGTHAHHIATFVSGSPVTQVAADVGTLMPGREVHDYAALLWRFANGARGSCTVSQAAAGSDNNIRFRIYGERGMLEWQHTSANYLRHVPLGEPARTLGRGEPYLLPAALRASRIARGHPEGLREAFANLYMDFAAHVAARKAGVAPDPLASSMPGIVDGMQSILFTEAGIGIRRVEQRLDALRTRLMPAKAWHGVAWRGRGRRKPPQPNADDEMGWKRLIGRADLMARGAKAGG